MLTLKEVQVQKVHSLIEAIKTAKANGDIENVLWNWGRAHSYVACLQSCKVLQAEETSELQSLALAARQDSLTDHPRRQTGDAASYNQGVRRWLLAVKEAHGDDLTIELDLGGSGTITTPDLTIYFTDPDYATLLDPFRDISS